MTDQSNEVEFSIYSNTMKSGQGEAQSKIFHKVQGKKGTWYVAVQENAADNVYVVNSNKNGMAGAKLRFTLDDGSVEVAHAPWHGNADSLYNDTGVDVRGQSHLTYVMSLGRHRSEGTSFSRPDIHTDVLEYALEPVLASHKWLKEKARNYAAGYGQKVYLSIKGAGGGSAGWEDC